MVSILTVFGTWNFAVRPLNRNTFLYVGNLYWRIAPHYASDFAPTVGRWPNVKGLRQWYARNTPGSIANIRKMVLCQGLPHCLRPCVDPCMARHAQSLNSSLHAWPQNLEAFLTVWKWAKKDKMWSVLLSNIRFLWFLQSMFLLSYLYQWCGFCWQSLCRNLWPQFVYIAVLLDWKINI